MADARRRRNEYRGIVADDARTNTDLALAEARGKVATLEALSSRVSAERAELWELVDTATRPD